MANVGQVINQIHHTNKELEAQLNILNSYEISIQNMALKAQQTFSGSVLNVDKELINSLNATLNEINETKAQSNTAIASLRKVAIM